MIKFSIIITTYNRERLIIKAIRSVLNQKYHNWQLIIIDDGSTDNTRDLINEYLSDERIEYHYQSNQERVVARNNALQLAKGDYITFLDSDDYLLPDYLETFNNILEKENISTKDILVVNRNIECKSKITIYPYRWKWDELNFQNNLIHFGLLESPANLNMCIHRSFYPNIKYKEDWLPYNEHYQFCLDLILTGYKFIHFNVNTSIIVQHDTNTTGDGYNFTMGRYKYISFFSKQLKIKNPEIKSIRSNLLTSTIFSKAKFPSKLLNTMFALYISPKRIVTREYWAHIKFFILNFNA